MTTDVAEQISDVAEQILSFYRRPLFQKDLHARESYQQVTKALNQV